MTTLEGIASSRARLTIADLLSVRPRPLSELAEKTGISVQAVLKHLKKIGEMGMLKKTDLRGNTFLGIRKVYSLQKGRVGDYSSGDLMIAHFSRETSAARDGATAGFAELESVAEDILIQRRRIRSLAKRLERLIVDLETAEERLGQAIRVPGLGGELELVALALMTEPSIADAKEVISKYYACSRAGEALARVQEELVEG